MRKAGHGARQALALALLLCWSWSGGTQDHDPIPRFGPPNSRMNTVDSTLPMNDASYAQNQKMLKMLNAARQKSMVSDADKLLKLARELDEEIAAAKPDSLTPSQLGRIARIEKLAHNVKVAMSTSVGGGPVAPDLFPPLDR